MEFRGKLRKVLSKVSPLPNPKHQTLNPESEEPWYLGSWTILLQTLNTNPKPQI